MGTINERIKEIRKINKLNQQQFAQLLGISQTHISKIESSKDMPSKKLQKLICIEFNINPEWLENGTGSINQSTINDDILINDCLIKTKKYLLNASKQEKLLYMNLLTQLPLLIEKINLNCDRYDNNYSNHIIGTIFEIYIEIMNYADFLHTETSSILGSSDIEGKIDEIFDLSEFYKEKIQSDLDALQNLYLGAG